MPLDQFNLEGHPQPMPDALVATEPKRHPGAFTAESARIAARKSVEARKAKANALLNVIQEPLPTDLQALPSAPDSRAIALARVLKQLAAIDDLMDKAKDAKSWDMLSRAKERLAKVWFHLGAIAAVAPIKTGQRQPRSTPAASWEPKLAPQDTAQSGPG